MFSVFAGIALFVGAFIIWNTFTMIVTQRSREIALLRAVGATRRQVLGNLLLEAVVLGAVASAIGIGLGLGVAYGLRVLMDVVGLGLPSTSLQLELETVWVCLLVGTVVTVVAAVIPARRATRVLPVEALREATPGSERPTVRRLVVGGALLALGVGGIGATLLADVDARVLGLGVLLVLLGVMVTLPFAVRPLAAAIATPIRARGLPGELAQQNAIRNPRRTASTAAALMVGLTLVVSMGVLASSLKASFGGVLSERLSADLFVTVPTSGSSGFSPSVVDAVAATPGVERVSASGWGQARFEGAAANYSSVDPATAESMMELPSSSGSTADLDGDSILVSEGAAAEHGWEVGDTVTASFAASGSHPLAIAGIYEKGWIQEDYIVSVAAQNAFAGPQLVSMVLVGLAPGVDSGEAEAALTAALADHPDALVRDLDGFVQFASGFLDTMLTFVTVMLLLAVVIALLGIVNTLALSVYERTRELGLLRAVGMTRSQVRSMVRWESVVIALIGAVSGAALGIGIGLAGAQAMQFWGVNSLSVPTVQVLLYVGLAALAGVLAAIGPARTAAKVDVLRAVVTE